MGSGVCAPREQDVHPPPQHHSSSDFHPPLLRVRVRTPIAEAPGGQSPSPEESTGRTQGSSARSVDSPMWKAVRAAAKVAHSLHRDSRFIPHRASTSISRNNSGTGSPHDSSEQQLRSKPPASRYPRMSRVMSWSRLMVPTSPRGQMQGITAGSITAGSMSAGSTPQHHSTGSRPSDVAQQQSLVGSASEGQLLLLQQQQRRREGVRSWREEGVLVGARRGSKSSSGSSCDARPRQGAVSQAAVCAQQQQQQQLAATLPTQADQSREASEGPLPASPSPPPQPTSPCMDLSHVLASSLSCALPHTPTASHAAHHHTHAIPPLDRPLHQHQHQHHTPPRASARKSLRSFSFQFSLDGHSRGWRHAPHTLGSHHITPHHKNEHATSMHEPTLAGGNSAPLPLPESSCGPVSMPSARCISTPTPMGERSSLPASQAGGSQQQLQQQQSWEHHIQDLLRPAPSINTATRRSSSSCSAIPGSNAVTRRGSCSAVPTSNAGVRRGSCSAIPESTACMSSASAAAKVTVGGGGRCGGSKRSVDVPVHKNGEVMRLGPLTSALLSSQ